MPRRRKRVNQRRSSKVEQQGPRGTRPQNEKGHLLPLQGRMEFAEVRPHLRQGLHEDDRTRAQVLHQRRRHLVHVRWRQPDAAQDGNRRQPHRGIRGNGLPTRGRDPSRGHHYVGHGDFPIIQLQGSSPSCIQSAHPPPCADESSHLCSTVMPFCSLRPYYTQQPSIALSVLSSGNLRHHKGTLNRNPNKAVCILSGTV